LTDENDFLKQFEQAQKLAQMFQAMAASQPPPQPSPAPTVSAQAHGIFDDRLHTPEMKILRSALPHLAPEYQRNVTVLLKMLELKVVMEEGYKWI